jgi:hypothetical protein
MKRGDAALGSRELACEDGLCYLPFVEGPFSVDNSR